MLLAQTTNSVSGFGFALADGRLATGFSLDLKFTHRASANWFSLIVNPASPRMNPVPRSRRHIQYQLDGTLQRLRGSRIFVVVGIGHDVLIPKNVSKIERLTMCVES